MTSAESCATCGDPLAPEEDIAQLYRQHPANPEQAGRLWVDGGEAIVHPDHIPSDGNWRLAYRGPLSGIRPAVQ